MASFGCIRRPKRIENLSEFFWATTSFPRPYNQKMSKIKVNISLPSFKLSRATLSAVSHLEI